MILHAREGTGIGKRERLTLCFENRNYATKKWGRGVQSHVPRTKSFYVLSGADVHFESN